MTARTIILAAAALTASCDQPADGCRYEGASFERDTVDVHVVTYQSEHELLAAARERHVVVGEGRKLRAFAVIRGDRCIMHIIDPAVSYQPQWIGHEFVHCIRGDWHPRGENQ